MGDRFTVRRITPATGRSLVERVIDRFSGRPSARFHFDSGSIPIAPALAKRVRPGLVLAGLETGTNTVSCGDEAVALPTCRYFRQARALTVRHQSWCQFLSQLCYSWLQEGIFSPITLPGYYLRIEVCAPPQGSNIGEPNHWRYLFDIRLRNTDHATVLTETIRIARKRSGADHCGLPIHVVVTHDRFGNVHVALPR